MHIETSFPERTIAQAIVVLRARVRSGRHDPPLSVAMVVGTSNEAAAWRKEAIDYLTARAKGVKYAPVTFDIEAAQYDSR
jgi:hypothetical protein